MAEFITQHRRGTTDEWKESTIIPKEGEIVIEEAGTTTKFKIGNGRDLFKDLEYPTDEIQKSLQRQIDVLDGRMNSFTNLEAGSTTGDAELIDARIGYDGTPHENIGDAIRSLGGEVDELKTGLQGFINGKAVDGLIYENNMLQLSASGIPVGDAVEVIGGSGGGGGGTITVVRLTNDNGTAAFSVTESGSAILKFTFTSLESEIPTGDGVCNIYVNSILKHTQNIPQGPNEIDVAKYLTSGSNTVRVVCNDIYGGSRTLVYTITVIQLRLETTFNPYIQYDSDLTFKYTPYGLIEKVIHFDLDGDEFTKTTLSSSGKQISQVIPFAGHGIHKLEVYATATLNEQPVKSNVLEFDVMFIDDSETPMIASVYDKKKVNQGDLVEIPYIVYDPLKLITDIELQISYMESGVERVYSTQKISVDRSLQKWGTRQYPQGNMMFTIKYGKYTKTHLVFVDKPLVNVEAETNDLELYLSSAGRSNNEENPDVWEYNNITTSFSNFNWKSNGWVLDENGDTCLRLSGDARAEINYKLFSSDFRAHGKTLEFEFVVRDVNNRDAVVIDCMSRREFTVVNPDTGISETVVKDIGFRATADTATFRSQLSSVECRYKDEERIRVGFTVDDNAERSTRLVCVYLNGILSGAQQYTLSDNFEQITPVNIKLGSSLCTLDLYTIRMYDTSLSPYQMTQNYIADISNIPDKIAVYNANDIYDENLQLSYEKLKTKIPTVTFIGKMPTYKGDKKKNSVRMIFEHPEHPELNFDDLLAQIDVQGTSSQYYARKNWKTKHNENLQHMPGQLPAKVFCLKVDYAEATGTHNTQAANFVETLYDKSTDKSPGWLPPQKDEPRVRTTIAGYPCVIFEKETEDSVPVFSSKGNFNFDKGAEHVFGFTDDYDTECWEFCNNTSAACLFKAKITNPESQSSWKDDFEARYPEESGDIYRFKEMHDWVVDTDTTAATDADLETPFEITKTITESYPQTNENGEAILDENGDPVLITNTKEVTITHTKDTAEYRIDKFRKEFEDHFDMHYMTIYYVFTFFALMVDQRAKNMFLTYWNNKWYGYFYDNDTSFGINNEGQLVFDYFYEDTDLLDNANVYNGQDSTLWVNFRECFSKEIEECYRTLRQEKLTYDKLIDQWITNGSNKYSASVYNEDAEFKYITMARPDETGASDTSNLYQIRGSGEQHFRYFVENRLNYCDSKWFAGDYPDNNVFLRIYTPRDENLAVPASPNIKVTPFSDMYAGVKYKANGTLLQKRLKKNQEWIFSPPKTYDQSGNEVKEIFNDTETAIYGASEISSLGDLSPLYCGIINTSKATKLTELIVGNHTKGYDNPNLREFHVGNNKLLKKVDITNCSGLKEALDISGCPNIEEVYAEGSNITGVVLPDAGYLRKIKLPKSINTLTIKDQIYIEEFTLERYDQITSLYISNCPSLDSSDLLAKCKNVERVHLTGLNWSFENINFLRSLYDRGVDADGNPIPPIAGTDNNNQNTQYAFLIGTCHITKLTGAEMLEIKEHFPYLDITFDEIECNVEFRDIDGNRIGDVIKVYNGAGIDKDPVELGLIPTPVKEEDAQYTYIFGGWGKKNDGIINEGVLDRVVTDLILYPAFDRIAKKYKVKFYRDPTDIFIYEKDELLKTGYYETEVLYGEDAFYPYDPPKKKASNPDIYEFTGWSPSPENIKEDTNCFAQYYLDTSGSYEIAISDLEYLKNDSNKTLIITNYTVPTADEGDNTGTVAKLLSTYQIPVNGTLEEYTVDAILGYSEATDAVVGFKHSGIEVLELPETLTKISHSAFRDCKNLKYITIPESVYYLGPNAFRSCNGIETVVYNARNAETSDAVDEGPFMDNVSNRGMDIIIGNTVESIPVRFTYQWATSMTNDQRVVRSLKFEKDSICRVISEYAFNGSELLELELPESLRDIRANSFNSNRSIEELYIPDNVENIGAYAFNNWTALKRLHLPSNLKTCADNPFSGSYLSYQTQINYMEMTPSADSPFVVRDNNTLIKTDSKGNRSIVIGTGKSRIGGVSTIGMYAFRAVGDLYSANIESGVEYIDTYGFQYCANLERVFIPSTVKKIGTGAFQGCTSLKSVEIEEGLAETYLSAFNSCGELKEVVLPKTLRRIDKKIFYDNTKLETVTFKATGLDYYGKETITQIDGTKKDIPYFFGGCPNLKVINVGWSEGDIPDAPWGAPDTVVINYNYTDEA